MWGAWGELKGRHAPAGWLWGLWPEMLHGVQGEGRRWALTAVGGYPQGGMSVGLSCRTPFTVHPLLFPAWSWQLRRLLLGLPTVPW